VEGAPFGIESPDAEKPKASRTGQATSIPTILASLECGGGGVVGSPHSNDSRIVGIDVA
jgi:hypothetical protein